MQEATNIQIGFIGLGLMGAAMVSRLQDKHYPLTVVANKSRAAIDIAVGRGAAEVDSPAELAQNSDIIMLCVDTSDTVESIMNGPNGILEKLKPGSLVIDFGTSIPASTRQLAKACEQRGAAMLDAPLGRTPAHALDGLLNIMAAGNAEDFKRAEAVLKDLGENVFHVGPIGAGHTLKLINNFFGMTTACAMSEAFVMADLAGLNRETLYNVMSQGPLGSGMMDMVKASAVDGKKNALEFSISNGRKDVGYYTEMAAEFNMQSDIAGSVVKAFDAAIQGDSGQRMVSEMVDIISEDYAK